MQHGIDNEPVAAEAYKQVLLASHPPGSSVDVEETGFWVHARMPHIGASPDRRVRMVVNGSEQPIRHVQIKCPHSKPLESFKELPDMVAFQVITELAVLRSHKAAGTPAAIDVFVWKADEEPVLHTITWEDVRQRWFTKILPKVNAFYFRLLQPQLNKRIRMRQQQAAVLHDGGPTAAQQSTSSQVTPMKLSLIAELQLDAAARMAATAAAAAVLEAAARVADASLMSPIKVTSPAFREGKRVLHKRTIKQGTVESVSGDQVMVAWDEDATGGLPDGEPVRKAKRRRATAAANLSIIPVDVSSSKYGELIGKHEGEPVVVISGKYAGELGVCGVQTGQNYRVMLSGSTQSVSIAASQLRRKIAQDEGVERCTSQHSKEPSIMVARSSFLEWQTGYCEDAQVELVLVKPSSRAELHRNLSAKTEDLFNGEEASGKGSRVLFSALYHCHRGFAKASVQLASEKPVASAKVCFLAP
ncbi:hypothetical protein WJX75_006873 [Coccomyxa subellipsoidea]|uniref:YqaJ viral recombinase domain-containing protein n=1 Tax=Coccomyxa subellipsoidea TaxID=248742 RepID=A0ABR2YF87_9CHLO